METFQIIIEGEFNKDNKIGDKNNTLLSIF